MFRKIIVSVMMVFLSTELLPQNTYTKEEVDVKLELQQERIHSYLDAVERENNSIDAKIAAQDKQIAHQDKQLENLKFIFGILLSLIGIIVAFAAFFIDKRNKDRFAGMLEEMKSAEDNALQELNRIRDIANMEINMAKIEMDDMKLERKTPD